jgi:hypothetical protein
MQENKNSLASRLNVDRLSWAANCVNIDSRGSVDLFRYSCIHIELKHAHVFRAVGFQRGLKVVSPNRISLVLRPYPWLTLACQIDLASRPPFTVLAFKNRKHDPLVLPQQ